MSRPATRLLVVGHAAAITPAISHHLRQAFPQTRVAAFDPQTSILPLLAPSAPVIVAGGDGTVEHVARALAGTSHPLGVVPLGTFNNFARSLGIPLDLEAAITTSLQGSPHPVTLGRVGSQVFLEVASIGLFAHALALGDATKDRQFGHALSHLQGLLAAPPFTYSIAGDLILSGSAHSLVFSNTPSVGSLLSLASTTPNEPALELHVEAGQSTTDIARRVLEAALPSTSPSSPPAPRFSHLEVFTDPPAQVYADIRLAGITPVTISAWPASLRILL